VFVSYARLDAEPVINIVRLLEQSGVTVWRDGDHILGGQYYGEEITHAIAHSRVVLLMCSPHSFQSDHVHREVLLTWDYYHRRYIPVWLAGEGEREVPERFRYCLVGCQWVDAHNAPPERWLPQLLKALEKMGVESIPRSLRPGEATPAPSPTPAPGSPSGEAEAARRGPRFRPGDRPVRGADWELDLLLGKGGFGEVWKAKHAELPDLRPVALKFCLRLDESSRDLLRHEANMVLRVQQQLQSSADANTRGIVPLLHAYLNNDPPCLEYPYIEGGTLVRLIDESRQSGGSLKPAHAQQIVKRVAQIVSAAHRATPKLVHRDLKPSNIMVERRGDAKIVLRVTDFGIGGLAAQPALERSRSASPPETMSSLLTGSHSPLYASPQQIRGDKPDPRDDVYALGVIWYQLQTGDLTAAAPTGRKWADSLRRKGMSEEAVELLSSCFESDPADRPDDAGRLAELLEALPRTEPAKSAGSATELPLADPPTATALGSPATRSEDQKAADLPATSELPSQPAQAKAAPRSTVRQSEAPAKREGEGAAPRVDPAPAIPPRRPVPPLVIEPVVKEAAAREGRPGARSAAVEAHPAAMPSGGPQHAGLKLKLKVTGGLIGAAVLLGIIVAIANNGTPNPESNPDGEKQPGQVTAKPPSAVQPKGDAPAPLESPVNPEPDRDLTGLLKKSAPAVKDAAEDKPAREEPKMVGSSSAPAIEPDDQETARAVVDLIERSHMLKPVIDDEFAMKWCDLFLKDLDSSKQYFLKADIEEFKTESKDLDDRIREGNFDFARKVFDRFLTRADERFKVQMMLLRQKHDFTVDEYLADDYDKLDYPADVSEANERQRKRVKLDLLSAKVFDRLDEAEAVHKLTIQYRDRNRAWHQIDAGELLQVYLTSLTHTIDPHSKYLGPRAIEDVQPDPNLAGVGAALRSEDGYAIVQMIVRGSTAEKDGRLKPGDRIIGIQNEDGSEIDLVGKKLSDVVRYIRGPRATKVNLIVRPQGTQESRIYVLTRQKIDPTTSQQARSKVIESKSPAGTPLAIGIIRLPSFYGDSTAIVRGGPNASGATADCRRLLADFKGHGVDCVVIDLRDNGGGLLDEATTLTGLFIDTGPIVQEKQPEGLKHFDDDDQGTAWDGPLVVLINKVSAGVSEIFAGAIKDYSRGLIIGDSSTFGMGTGQTFIRIQDHVRSSSKAADQVKRGALYLSTQQIYRVNGDGIQLNGVAPHIHIPSMNDYRNSVGEGAMANALKFDKVVALPHDNYNRVPNDLVALLDQRSAERRKSDAGFQKLNQEIQRYVERNAKHSIALNESKYRADYLRDEPEGKQHEDKQKQDRNQRKDAEPDVWASGFYNDEVIRIVTDYLTLGSKVLAGAPERVK
jgi:carboxyl-terminal processing protease